MGLAEIGPQFSYEHAPDLFLGRTGAGPLDVVWDTNVLIDYLSFGFAMWEGEPLEVGEDRGEQLEGIHLLVTLWTVRDIRFHILPETMHDAKRSLASERRNARTVAIDELARALSLDAYAETQPRRRAISSDAENALRAVPEGHDRILVRSALELDAHVFLTNDKGILRAEELLSSVGLLVVSPLDLVVELAACGAIDCLWDRQLLRWPAPDLQRISHIIEALGSTD